MPLPLLLRMLLPLLLLLLLLLSPSSPLLALPDDAFGCCVEGVLVLVTFTWWWWEGGSRGSEDACNGTVRTLTFRSGNRAADGLLDTGMNISTMLAVGARAHHPYLLHAMLATDSICKDNNIDRLHLQDDPRNAQRQNDRVKRAHPKDTPNAQHNAATP
jgi:hypothetical protein